MDITPREIKSYVTIDGKVPYRSWFHSLDDDEVKNRVRARLDRLSSGNLGDFKPVGSGVLELRMDFGPGYRVYFGMDGKDIIILLCGGNKNSQRNDIRIARDYWADYRRRINEEK